MSILVAVGYQTYANFLKTIQEDGSQILKSFVDGKLCLVRSQEEAANVLGAIPRWIDAKDPTPITHQIHRSYSHGGGWMPFEGFVVSKNEENMYSIKYPADPEYNEIARMFIQRQDSIELLVFFHHSWVMHVSEKDGQDRYEIARID